MALKLSFRTGPLTDPLWLSWHASSAFLCIVNPAASAAETGHTLRYLVIVLLSFPSCGGQDSGCRCGV